MTPDLAAQLAALERQLATVAPDEIPGLVGELERIKTSLLVKALGAQAHDSGQPEAPGAGDQLLTADEAAPLLSVKPSWLYRHAKHLPFARKLSPKCLRFSEAGLRRWQAAKRA